VSIIRSKYKYKCPTWKIYLCFYNWRIFSNIRCRIANLILLEYLERFKVIRREYQKK